MLITLPHSIAPVLRASRWRLPSGRVKTISRISIGGMRADEGEPVENLMLSRLRLR
jgi:hypothetical protein